MNLFKYVFPVTLLSLLTSGAGCKKTNGYGDSDIPIVDTTAPIVAADSQLSANAYGLDTGLFNRLQLHLVHGKPSAKWPVNAGYPLPGAILPFKRVVAFYGNFYSKGMGILGELPPDVMLQKLQAEVKDWERADPMIPVQLLCTT